MELNGTRAIPANRDLVWVCLNDPEVLRVCIPGCEELSGNAEEGFEAIVKQKIGPVQATFRANVRLSDVNPPEGYVISGEGKGGMAGFANGNARVSLVDVGETTELSFTVNAQVGGKIAQLGSRLIDGFARKLSDQFFDSFQVQVENRVHA
ncbi:MULTISPECIES: CoxG family protein [unclassified Hyphomicrobium]|jgi:carbon monoxide dehydrogenase subunit G|uniref:CoxG family protein n=1 Tax=unclassified Hyphomicrobium TaxID=2619925 RepID=UPI000213F886|nr:MULTISPECIES: carbon monoxide dehydrogenase subunit G [unclassified Hyphomicrobium]CCB63481.1 putative carbon monoxide dehydrogenase accessory protein CoxG [Hyphomicrobium sp. MC1]